MPFDALVQPKVRDSAILTRIGLIPVSMDVVDPHKRRAEQHALAILSKAIGTQVAHIRITRNSHWVHHNTRHLAMLPQEPTVYSHCRRWLRTLIQFTPRPDYATALETLSRFTQATVSLTFPVTVGIPPKVMTLATRVQNRLYDQGVESHIAVEAFNTDPLLYLDIDGNWHCLAIWDYDHGYPVMENLASLT